MSLVKKYGSILLVALSALLFLQSISAAANTASSTAMPAPQQLIQNVSDQLLSQLKVAPKKSKPANFYYKLVDNVVSPYVDFDLIAKRVMAQAYVVATPDQRQRFAQVFRTTLLDTYSKAISNYGDQQVTMLPFTGIQSQGAHDRATVKMEIHTKTGDTIPVNYALYQTDQGAWKLENITISGVNLGLTFRNQFQDAWKSNKGDIDQAIIVWQQLAKKNEEAKK